MKKSLLLLALLALPASLFAAPTTYTVDPVHSSVNFKVRHFVSTVNGNFGEFSGKIVLDPANLAASSATGEIRIPSVNTNSEKRDAHLKSDSFFNAEKYPAMTFKSTAWKAAGEPETYLVTGDLTFAGVTKPVTIKLTKTGEAENPMTKKPVAGFEATGKLNRSDWGMTYGKGIVGDEVAIEIEVEAGVSK